ncbi:hypothetical protein HHI36_000977 [Cryptolaemus montrouzieri]|uniref:Pinin n=1 Tax=Cryptolaemus montrouzieri TaxID=559131 RepID=A0ABD2P6C3_9CUCU
MTDILKSFSALQSELDVAKTSLKGVDENIKRLIGRDPSEVITRPPVKKNNSFQSEERSRPRSLVNHNEERRFKNSRLGIFSQDKEQPPIKKRNTEISVFKRLSDRPIQDDGQSKQNKGMISKVIITPKDIPSRQERLDAQSKDAISVARNKRMFGALLGTLQKFQQEETKLKKKEDKRAQLEKKIEEHEIKEKEEIKKERQELFFNRKKKQAEIKMIELKMIRMKEYSAWEESQKHRINFIQTKAKPHIHFLPRKLNDANKTLLENSKTNILDMIDKKREQVQSELLHIEERGKKIFEPRKFQQENKEQDENDNQNGIFDDGTLEDLQHPEDDQENVNTSDSLFDRDDNIPIESAINRENREDEKIQDEENFPDSETSQVIDQSANPNVEISSNNADDSNQLDHISVLNDSNQNNVVNSSSTDSNQHLAANHSVLSNDNSEVDNNII